MSDRSVIFPNLLSLGFYVYEPSSIRVYADVDGLNAVNVVKCNAIRSITAGKLSLDLREAFTK
jgi:hypothetical protein